MVDFRDESFDYLEEAEQSVLSGDILKAKVILARFAKLNSSTAFRITRAYCSWAECLSSQYKYPHAILKYRKALQIDPKLFRAYNGWGVCLSKMGKYDDAIQQFKKATEISVKNPIVAFNFVLVLLLKGSKKEALKTFAAATKRISQRMLGSVSAEFEIECEKLERRMLEIEDQEEILLMKERIKGIEYLLNLLSEKQNA